MSQGTPAGGISVLFDRSGLSGGTGSLRRFTAAVLSLSCEGLDYPEAELSVLYCSRRRIRTLNAEHRGFDEETDVLSFPAFDPSPAPGTPGLYLGDLAICLAYTEAGAAKHRREFVEEVALLLVHGLLHLVGHDHDTREKKDRMWKETRRLLKLCRKVERPNLQMKGSS